MTILKEQGCFWFADDQTFNGSGVNNNRIHGTLEISEDGGTSLRLEKSLFERTTKFPLHFSEGYVDRNDKGISGFLSQENKHVLLFGLFQHAPNFFVAQHCFVGSKPVDYQSGSFKFEKLRVSLKGLESWLRVNKIEDSIDGGDITFSYKKPEATTYETQDSTIKILQYAAWTHSETSATLQSSAVIDFCFKEGQRLEKVLDKFICFEDLITLITEPKYRLDWPSVTLTDNKGVYKHYFPRQKKFTPNTDKLEWCECWTRFLVLQENLGILIETMENKRKELGPGIYTYLSTCSGMPSFVEDRFLSLVTGLEALHRRKSPHEFDVERAKRREKVLQQIEDQGTKEWLGEALKYTHEICAEKRIRSLIVQMPVNFHTKSIKRIVHNCVEIRNAIIHAHNDEREEDYSKYLKDLAEKNELLSVLYHLALLYEIGLDGNQLCDAINMKIGLRDLLKNAKIIRDGVCAALTPSQAAVC